MPPAVLKQVTLEHPGTGKDENTVSIRSSEINLWSGPGVSYCPVRMLGVDNKKKVFRMIGRFDTPILIIIDGLKGGVHKAMLPSQKTYD